MKVGDLVTIPEKHLTQYEEAAYGIIVADGANLEYYTKEECERLGYEYPRENWWSVLWSQGIDAGRISDASSCLLEIVTNMTNYKGVA
jgi:hypothetical protein